MANFQETIRYYDVKEFPQERDTKRLYVELKNSETRTRAIDKINLTYKKIIDQLLRDSHYYEPLMSALVDDWAEQTSLVQQTYQIGRPAIHDSKQLKKEAKRLRKVVLKEDKEHYDELHEFKNILSGNPKIVKELVRRDVSSQFPRAEMKTSFPTPKKKSQFHRQLKSHPKKINHESSVWFQLQLDPLRSRYAIDDWSESENGECRVDNKDAEK